MFTIPTRWAVPAVLGAAALAVQAQVASPPPAAAGVAQAVRPDPLDARASVPALDWQSSFARYRRMDDDKAVSWREANETVTRIGGWRVYARDAQAPDVAPSAASPATPVTGPSGPDSDTVKPVPMPHGHAGHKSR